MTEEARDAVLMARYGWRRSRAPACPRVVVGKRCLVGYSRRRCLCQDYYPRLLDHSAMWLARDGTHVLTGEPYDFAPDDVTDLLEAAARLGLSLNVEVSSDSPWYPGHTTLVIVRPTRLHP